MRGDAVESVLEETDRSIAAAIADGTLDPELSAGPIAALRLVATQLDHPDFPIVEGKLDNVSLPTYLRYCQDLRLTPASRGEAKKEGAGGKLAKLRAVESAKSTSKGTSKRARSA